MLDYSYLIVFDIAMVARSPVQNHGPHGSAVIAPQFVATAGGQRGRTCSFSGVGGLSHRWLMPWDLLRWPWRVAHKIQLEANLLKVITTSLMVQNHESSPVNMVN